MVQTTSYIQQNQLRKPMYFSWIYKHFIKHFQDTLNIINSNKKYNFSVKFGYLDKSDTAKYNEYFY